ncbi:hypothetical protein AC579_2836 [Pseudocercospora musae]|uniref:RING-type domain-containing protein n=1 Tax=Pseudocercospora musae TaxID=113226 RepID=A0A139GWI9_9PEZI|nr:hypothetical protein AC579_2836 [Pseudocercospora musae]
MPGEDRHFANEGGSRKRRKMDRDYQSASNTPADAIVLSSDALVKAESGPSLPLQTVKAEMDASHSNGHCEHEASLRTLQTDLEAMRQLITCKICLRFLYEPYALTCGHTYCYSCIMNWMGKDQAQQKKKTCPDCRTIIREQPAPSYLIKEMVLIFSNRVELLPEGETSEEHHAMAREEAETVAKDKADMDQETGGLFQGRFKRGGRLNPVLAIRDLSDNVYRCPNCAFEIQRNWCGPCGMRVVTDEDDEDMSDETDSMDRELDEDSIDHELDRDMGEDELAFGYEGPREDGWTDDDDDDDDDDDGGDIHPYHPAEAFGNHNYPLPYDSDRDPGDFETDTDASLDAFIDDRDRVDDDVEDESEEAVSTPAVPRRRRGPAIVLSDDEDDDEHEGIAPPRREQAQSEGASSAGATRESSEPDSDDEEPVVQSRHANRRQQRSRHLDIDSEVDEVDEEDDLDDDGFDGELEPPSDHEAEINLANHLAIHGYSPPPFESDDGETDTGANEYSYGNYAAHDDNASEAIGGMSEDAEDDDEDDEEDESDDMHSMADGYASD